MNKKSIYFNCKTGISSDMTLACLLDMGANVNTLREGLLLLGLDEFDIRLKKEERYGIKGSNVFFDSVNNKAKADKHFHRSYREIEEIINSSRLSEEIKNKSISIYKAIGEAEAKVHETDLDNVHFHEVGRDTAVLNIVGVAICLEELKVGSFFCSDIHDGSGFIQCSHGKIPVPVPAVLAMLEGTEYRLVRDDFDTEMVTPSGLGILKGLGALNLDITDEDKKIFGCGFGKKDVGKLSVLKAYLLDKQ